MGEEKAESGFERSSVLMRDQISLGGLQRTGVECRAQELCEYASGRQNHKNKLEEREPRHKRASRKIKRSKGRAELLRTMGIQEGQVKSLSLRGQNGVPFVLTYFLLFNKIMENKAHLEIQPIFYSNYT